MIVQLIELRFKHSLGLFKLLYREVLRAHDLCLLYAVRYLFDLLLYYAPLPLDAYRYLFKLAVADDNCIVIARSDARAELLAVRGLKILFCGDQ